MKDIIRIKIPFSDIYTTVFIVKTESGSILFDTGTYPTDIDRYILPALEKAEVKDALKYVFLSHMHGDHAGGLGRLLELYPDITVFSRSEELKEKFGYAKFVFPDDGQELTTGIAATAIPGHSPDAMALYDRRSKTLLTGDCLQLYGVYGSGDWGCNITDSKAHFDALDKLKLMEIDTLIASHDYYPLGYKAAGVEVKEYIEACKVPVLEMKQFYADNSRLSAKEVARLYNDTKKVPRVSYKVFEQI